MYSLSSAIYMNNTGFSIFKYHSFIVFMQMKMKSRVSVDFTKSIRITAMS